MKQIDYALARCMMQPGDLMAFGGNGFISSVIKLRTQCNVSHVGAILQTNVPTVEGMNINQVIESTSLDDGFAGVTINRMSTHIEKYDGEIWWLPLGEAARTRFKPGIFFGFMLDQVGKPYDAPQAILSAIDYLPDNRENLDKLFCSELVTAAYEKSGLIGETNASEMTPADVCRFDIYSQVFQLKGGEKELFPSGFAL